MPFRPPTRLLARSVVWPSLLALAACGGSIETQFPPACPRVSILADAADLTRFRATSSRDLTDMVLDGRMTGVSGTCERGDDGQLLATLVTGLELSRGPATQGRAETAPLFVAVVKDGRVLDKRLFRVTATFPANTDRVRLVSNEINLTLPIGGSVTGASYDVFVGFQVSPSELATNRARGVR